jgi:hypothetical protein
VIALFLLATVVTLGIFFLLLKSSPRIVFGGGLVLWLAAAIVWLIGRAFPATTYKWTILLLPWSVMILAGGVLLGVGTVRLISSKSRS